MKLKQILMFSVFLLGLVTAREAQAFYNPSTGRWLSRDPIGELGGPNVYTFVGNNCNGFFDVLGQFGGSACAECNNHCLGIQMRCKVTNGPHYSPSGTVQPQKAADGKRRVTFTSEAVFEHNVDLGYCAGCCEVRQFIKWSSDADRPANNQFEPGEKFPPETWYEDTDDEGGHYGHRDKDLMGAIITMITLLATTEMTVGENISALMFQQRAET